MHNKFLNWVQDKTANLRSKRAKARQAQDEPKPLLPPWTYRSGALTPTPSCPELRASTSAATADCAFFQHLSPEIRRKVLVTAFGNRTMHMSLEFNHPKQLVELGISRWERYMPPTAQHPPHRLHPDEQAPIAWQWRGCPCWHIGRPSYPHRDRCLPGVARCWKDASAVLDCCLIGSMGWLLTCRQAYVEGIEVLYSTNTFQLSNKHSVIIHHLQSLLSTSRLSMIVSIELNLSLYDITGLAENDNQNVPLPRDAGRFGLRAILEAIPRALPRLRAVCIDIHGSLFPSLQLAERPPFYDQYLFEPVDDMVRKLGPQLKEFILVIPFTISRKSIPRAASEGWKIKRGDWAPIFWRPISASNINSEAEPGPEVETTVEGSGERGYWITEGYFDSPYPGDGCFCTDSTNPELHDAINAINAELDSWTDKDKPQPRKT